MGKTAKPKARQISTHSRAARRAASPSLDAPTAAKPSNIPRHTSTSPDPKTTKPHILAAHTNSGISKSKLKGKPMKRQQRLRAVEAAEKAEANAEKLALKVAKSLGREKKVKERRKGWEDINEAKRKKAAKGNAYGALGDEEEEGGKGGGEWETLGDEAMDGADEGGVNDHAEVQAVPLVDEVDPEL